MPWADRAKKLAWQRRYDRAKVQRWLAAGGCRVCGTPVTGFQMCFRCRLRSARAVAKRRKQAA